MSLVRFRSKALGYDNCSYLSAFHEFQKTLKSACNLGKPVIRYEMSERQQFNMREWLSWWSTTLPRSGSRVRVPSRALNEAKTFSYEGFRFFLVSKGRIAGNDAFFFYLKRDLFFQAGFRNRLRRQIRNFRIWMRFRNIRQIVMVL